MCAGCMNEPTIECINQHKFVPLELVVLDSSLWYVVVVNTSRKDFVPHNDQIGLFKRNCLEWNILEVYNKNK